MNPGELSEKLMEEAARYSKYSDELAEILAKKAAEWLQIREGCTSDKQADKQWDATESGVKETGYKMKLKALEKSMSATRTQLRTLEMEARNIF